MFFTGKNNLFLSCLFLLIAVPSNAQLIDPDRTPSYHAVFSETGAFDASYLTQLEKACSQNLPDTVKLAIGNDRAYYWHTRNLDKAYDCTRQVLAKAIGMNNKLWEERLPKDALVFCVSDNGIGKPENIIAKGTGFGTELVNLLVRQLDGKLVVDASNAPASAFSLNIQNRINGYTN